MEPVTMSRCDDVQWFTQFCSFNRVAVDQLLQKRPEQASNGGRTAEEELVGQMTANVTYDRQQITYAAGTALQSLVEPSSQSRAPPHTILHTATLTNPKHIARRLNMLQWPCLL